MGLHGKKRLRKELLNEANFFIREMKRTREINRLKEKYFNNNAWVR